MSSPRTLTVGAGQRALALGVLLVILAAFAAVGTEMNAVATVVLGVFGIAALVSTVGNFGDRLHVDERGLVLENVVLARLGLRAPRRAAWGEVLAAVDLDKRTLFLTVEGQRRWVLDAFEGLELVRRELEARGISVDSRTRPRLRDLAGGSRDVPPS